MMDYRHILEAFKEQNIKAGGAFSFSLFPILFLDLKNYGADRSIITQEFVKDFHSILLPGANPSVLLISIDYITYYSNLLLSKKAVAKAAVETPAIKIEQEAPKTVVVSKPVETKTVEARPAQKITSNKKELIPIDYDSPIPKEEDEGDPLHTPADQMINLKPEDCADIVIDWDFINLCNAVGSKK